LSNERNFSVRLSARVDQYVSALDQARKATTGFTQTTSRNMAKVGSDMQAVGGWATTRVTLPLVAVGTAAGKLAYDFETAFSRMEGLANVPAAEIANLKESVLDLGRETAVAPQELAEALYFAASAGLDSAQAMDAVSMAARASTAGLGSATDVVGLVASAMASYGADALDAAKATDILTATVRAGRADPAELAGTLGRILPIAAKLGVEFEEVGGATAYMSNVLSDTGRTVTAMSGFFTKLVAPTKQGREALKEMGTSSEELQRVIGDQGLVAALELLRTKGFGENAIALRALFDEQEAYVAAQTLLADANGQLVGTMGAVADSAGALGTAYDAVAGTDAFALKQAMTDVKASLTEVGMVLLPLAADVVGPVAGAFADIASAIADLPAPLRGLVLGFIGLAAAAGPILSIGGSMVRNFESIKGGAALVSTGLQRLGMSASTSTAALGYLGLAVAAVGVAYTVYESFSAAQEEVDKRARAVAAGLDEATTAAIANAGATDGARVAHTALASALTSTGEDGEKLTSALGTLGLQTGDVLDIFGRFRTVDEATGYIEGLIGASSEFSNLTAAQLGTLSAVIAQVDDLSSVYRIAGEQGINLTESQRRIVAAMEELQDQAEKSDLDQMVRDYLATESASSDLNGSLLAQAEAQTGLKRTGDDLLPLYEEYVGLLAENKVATGDATTETSKQQVAIESLAESQERAVLSGDQLNVLMMAIGNGLASAASQADSFGDALDRVMAPFADIEGAQRNWEAGIDNLTESFKKNGATLDIHTEKGRNNRNAIDGQVDGIKQWMVALVQSGASTEDAAAAGDMLRESLIGQLDQLGLTREEAEAYVNELGLTPESIRTAVELQKAEEAKKRVEELLERMGEIPEEVTSDVQALIDSGQFDEAERRLLALQTIASFGASMNVRVANTGGGWGGVPVSADGRITDGPMLSLIGEAGAEVVLPLTRPDRMRKLLSDSRVLPQVLSALGMRAFADGGIIGNITNAGGNTNKGTTSQLMANRFETGDLSAGDYRSFLDTQLGGLEKYSDEWMQVWRQIRTLDQQAAQASADRVAEEDRIQQAMLETGAVSASSYETYLLRRLNATEQYSNDWMAIWRQLQEMAREETNQQDEVLRGTFDRAEALRDLADAERDFAEASQDAADATMTAGLAAFDSKRTPEDRARLDEEARRARERLGEVAFAGAGARAAAAGFAKGTPEWARFVRSEIEGYRPSASAETQGVLDRLLLGVPQFANGGFIPARAGGTLGLLAEAGQGEFALPEGKLTSMLSMASSAALSQVMQLVGQMHQPRTEGGPLIGSVTVGSRDDLSATRHIVEGIAWQSRIRQR
jgi:TP901 family phage tail tape measure protein